MTKLAPNTIKNYKHFINILIKKLGLGEDYSTKLNNAKRVIKIIRKKYKSTNTRKSYISNIRVLIKEHKEWNIEVKAIKEYEEAFKEEAEKVRQELETNKTNIKQQENWLEWPKIIDYRDEYEKKKWKDWKDYQKYVLISLYTYMPPTRAENYTKMRIVKQKSEANMKENTIVSGEVTVFVFNKYKTYKTYGSQTVIIPKKLVKILKEWIKIKPSGEYLLVQDDGKTPMNADNVSKRLKNIFKEMTKDKNLNFSIDMLRHSFLSHFMSTHKLLAVRKEVARIMGHNIETQLQYIKKDQNGDGELKEYLE